MNAFLCPGGEDHDGWLLYGEDCDPIADGLLLSSESIVGPYPHYEIRHRQFASAIRLGAVMRGRNHYEECVEEFRTLVRKNASRGLRKAPPRTD